MAEAQSIQEKLQALCDDFALGLPAKLDNINSIWQKSLSSKQVQDINDLIFHCHKLAGSGTSFGFKDISDLSRRVEVALIKLRDNANANQSIWSDSDLSEISILIDQLLEQKNSISQSKIKSDIANKPTFKSEETKKLIYIHEKNSMLLKEIISKLEIYNYNVRLFVQLDELKQAFETQIPAALLIDLTLFKSDTKALLMKLKKEHDFSLIHLADSSNFKERLEAVRIGVDYYFTKPVDISNLIDTLDIISNTQSSLSSKVLIVDDSLSTSQFYALYLNNNGIETKIVTDPFEVMDTVIEFKPELILLDLHMPKCNGLELAAVIRQQENYISTPIIFLSGETDAQKQLQTLEMGADEFLTKPINIQQLVAVVKNKVIRYRQLSSYMHNDSLTGLLNHTSILSALETEISRAQRESNNVCYAMIDIDFFKKVNDTYGHHMGDMVLKSISRFLKQSLRITDIIGRYGGEEFVIILPDIDATQASVVLQKILDAFYKIDFVHYNHKFNVSFSCGIADLSSYPSSNEMIDAADKALYKAKEEGRHCIRIAP